MTQKLALNTLIHVGLIQPKNGIKTALFLRKKQECLFVWFKEEGSLEIETPIIADTISEAIRLAWREWKSQSFRPLGCGYRYTLPERDEHGAPAYFYQMVASYSSPNGIYLDEELGTSCIVHNVSQEARGVWERLKMGCT